MKPQPLTKEHFQALCLSLGLTTGVGIAVLSQTLNQGCAGGQCATCGACVTKLPLLALPIVIDGAVVYGKKWMKSRQEKG